MKRIKLAFWGFCIALTILWLAADPILRTSWKFSAGRLSFINYTGIIAMGVMAVAMILAVRPVVIETRLGGLDKTYRLHRWLGIAGAVMAIAHWIWIGLPQWLATLGLMKQAPRAPRGGPAPTDFALLRSLSGPARSVGSWGLYAVVVLVLLALIYRFPYRWFLRTHRLLAIAYLLLVFHAVVLMKYIYWTTPFAWVFTPLLAGGCIAAVYILLRKVGQTRRAVGIIDSVTHHADVRTVAVAVRIKDRWNGHQAGQFAFVNFDDGEGTHPFTISSTWKDDGLLQFLIKELGDYTRDLSATLKVGDLVTLEGPYGRFTFDGRKSRQIWISAGIGITPFISRMQELAEHPDPRVIDLFHATGARDTRPIDGLRQLAQAAKVNLHVWVLAEDGRLTGERVRQEVPDWQSADVWFCGPVPLGAEIRKDFRAAGLASKDFHQELFHLR
ncbi:MAG: ferric reductase-like transmembrane domain-containing protein [Gemmatimonadota bacterium]|nr:ferric reductase-like transmembrane domain-containing protein [Gemmatimonadota bacterium]